MPTALPKDPRSSWPQPSALCLDAGLPPQNQKMVFSVRHSAFDISESGGGVSDRRGTHIKLNLLILEHDIIIVMTTAERKAHLVDKYEISIYESQS